MISTTIKSKVILSAIAAVKDTADARKHFKFWPNYFKVDPTWGLKLDQETINDISELIMSPRTLRELYDERVEQNYNDYQKANKNKQPSTSTNTNRNTSPKKNNKPDIDLDDDGDDYLDNLHDLLDDDNDQPVIPKQPQNSQPPTPKQQPQPQPQNTGDNSNDYILNKASLYAKGSTVYWASKRWGKMGLISGTVIGKKPGTVSDFLVIETSDGRIITIDPEITQVSKKKPTWAQRLSTAIMGESIEQFLKS